MLISYRPNLQTNVLRKWCHFTASRVFGMAAAVQDYAIGSLALSFVITQSMTVIFLFKQSMLCCSRRIS